MKKIFSLITNDVFIKYYLLVFISIQPILELDLYLSRFYQSIGILALSTILRVFGIAFLALICFFKSQHKLRDFICWSIYLSLIFIYIFFHFKISAKAIIKLPASYYWSGLIELKYIIFLILPFIFTYCVSKIKFTKHDFNLLILFVSCFISLNIVLTNILLSSFGSYGGITYQNIFTWFSNIYESYTPRELTSIGFYFSANPISALLFICLPILVKALYEEKHKLLYFLGLLLVLFAMLMLGTKVAGYGCLVVFIVVLLMYLFFVLIKRLEFKKSFLAGLVALNIISAIFIPFSPAHINAGYTYEREGSFGLNERNLKDSLLKLKELDPQEFKYALIYQLENIYLYYITFPREYYDYYYPYQYDPEFYFDVLSLPFHLRRGGRQFQNYFTVRKFNELSSKEKLLGMSFSRFSNGGIVLEQDFKRQYYTLGPIGFSLTTAIYLVIWLILGLVFLIKIKDISYFNFENTILFLSYSLAMFSAYFSGHVLDEILVSLIIAFILGYLIRTLGAKDVS